MDCSDCSPLSVSKKAVIARRAQPDVAIRSLQCFDLDGSTDKTTGFRGRGLPRRFAPRNDMLKPILFLQSEGTVNGLFLLFSGYIFPVSAYNVM